MTHEIAKFEYSQLDTETASFLQSKENNMREIVGKAYTELGRELAEAQAELSRQGGVGGGGVFVKWLEYIGMERKQANRLIQRFELVVGTKCPDGRSLIEDLPVSLSYEISKPSAESTEAKSQAKSEVLAGDVASLKEYRERIAELERRAKQAESSAQTAQRSEEITRRQLDVHKVGTTIFAVSAFGRFAQY